MKRGWGTIRSRLSFIVSLYLSQSILSFVVKLFPYHQLLPSFEDTFIWSDRVLDVMRRVFGTLEFLTLFAMYKISNRGITGFTDFRPKQLEVINAILCGYDVFAMLPTGSGKSFLYQILSLSMDGFTIVVTPLVALMIDQVAHSYPPLPQLSHNS